MAVSLLPALFASILAVSAGAVSSAVKEHRLVRTEKFGTTAMNLPEVAGSFDECSPAADNGNHIPLPNSQDQRTCSQYIVDGHELAECSCMRRKVDGVALITPKQEYTCCHRHVAPGTHRWRCYTDCVHPQGNGQNESDTLLEEEQKTVEIEERATMITSANLPEQHGSFQNCKPTGSGNHFVPNANSPHGQPCTAFADPDQADETLVECGCERIATLGEAIPVNETGLYETEYTCCQKDLTEGVNRGKCLSDCVRA